MLKKKADKIHCYFCSVVDTTPSTFVVVGGVPCCPKCAAKMAEPLKKQASLFVDDK